MLKDPKPRNSLKTLKSNNRILVLSYMRDKGPVVVNEVALATRLSKMTVHKIIEYYMQRGMINHAGKGDSTEEGGKKPNLYAFNPNCRFLLACRLGSTHLTTCLVNLEGAVIGALKCIPLDGVEFSQAMVGIRRDFDAMVSENRLNPANCLAVVVGCQGIVDVENGVYLAYSQNHGWGTHLPVAEYLGELFPPAITVRVDSWWRHLAHAEIRRADDPAARKRFFLIGNYGDDVAGGMVADGRVLAGATGFAGEVGHIVVNPDSTEVCVCGGAGCLQAMVAPSRVVAAARGYREVYPESLVFAGKRSGALDLFSLAACADGGDEMAVLLLDRVASHFAVAINNIVQICDPGLVVLFGDYARLGDLFMSKLRRKVNGMTMRGIDKRTRIECSMLDGEEGVVGAANLMADTLFIS